MKTILKKLKRRNKVEVLFFFLVSITYILGFIYFTKNLLALKGIETIIRYFLISFFLIYLLVYFFWNLVNIISKKHKSFIITTLITILFIVLFVFSGFLINYFYNKMASLSENEKVLYTSNLITKIDTKFSSNSVIGMISNENDPEGYILANKLISKEKLTNKITRYDDYIAMLADLYSGKIAAAFVQGNYITLYNSEEKFVNIATDTKIIYNFSEEMQNTDAQILSNKDFNDPITILVMGVDSTIDGLNANAAFNGDTLMLITFNPHTLNATMFSIPRDTYVPIACKNNAKAKINSSAAYGTECVLTTVKNFTGINIDYYVKINFKGVVDLVDALGGVEVNVEKPDVNTFKGQVCEQNSDRQFGSRLVCMNSGLQTLNGEQALAYSRCRHLYLISDLARIQHQQDIVTAISQKVVKLSNFNDFEKVLNAVTKNIATNMSTNQMLSGYKVIKSMVQNAINGDEFITINKSYLETYNLSVYLESSHIYTSALGYYPNSLKDITDSMKVNLELQDPELIKTFSFSADETYIIKTAGKGIKTGITDKTLPNFENSTTGYTEAWCTKNNIKCTFEKVTSESPYYKGQYEDKMVVGQSIHDGTLLSKISSIIFYVNDKIKENPSSGSNNNNNNNKPTDNTTTDKKDDETKTDGSIENSNILSP